MRKLKEAGDTIVEVLIAIVIISTVLVGAFEVTTRNTAATQDTQEHTVALKMAESQLETLQNTGSFPSSGSTCFYNGAPNDPSNPSQCDVTPVPGVTYHVSLVESGNPAVYKADVQWVGINGQNNDVSLLYRPEGAP